MEDSSSSNSNEFGGTGEDKKEHKKRKQKKSKNKEREHRKPSKKSKRSRRRDSSSSEEGTSSSGEEEWVEARAGSKMDSTITTTKKVSGLKLKTKVKKEKKRIVETCLTPKSSQDIVRDEEEWSAFGNMLPTFSNDTNRSKKQKEREEMRQLSSIDRAGQSDKELNPYWKDGGIGLPVEDKPKEKVVSSGVGDGGLAWLKKSFERAKQQAKDDGRPLEEIVAERWGSLETFYTLLEEAENKAQGDSSGSHQRRDAYGDRDRGRHSKSFQRVSRYSDSDEERSSARHDREDRNSARHRHHRDRDRDDRNNRSKDMERSWRKPGSESRKTQPQGTKLLAHETSNPVETVKMPELSVVHVDEEEEVVVNDKPKILTDTEMNELNAKIFKAELLGDSETIATLKLKLSEATKVRDDYLINGKLPDDKPKKVVTKVIIGSQDKRRTKDKPTESHIEGQRVRYFPDDDKHSLKSMFEKEKMNTVEDENVMFSRLMAKSSKATDEYDVDDIFVDKASSSKQAAKDQKREIQNILYEEKASNKVLDNCQWCFDGKHLQKNLIVSIGQTCFLCIPPYQSLTEGHCLILPTSHVTCATQLDEDVWAEMQKFRKALIRMFSQSDQDVIFFERAVFLQKQPHMYLECVPLPKETGELAPIYFKKAIDECETEWSQNKKVVNLRDRDVRRAVPKGLPYFSVEFGDDNCGFAHVIEDEKYFPSNFAQEIIGGMLELDHQVWRKQKKDDFNTQREKLMKFLKLWAPFDFTRDETNKSNDV